jgi:hypothetical protein
MSVSFVDADNPPTYNSDYNDQTGGIEVNLANPNASFVLAAMGLSPEELYGEMDGKLFRMLIVRAIATHDLAKQLRATSIGASLGASKISFITDHTSYLLDRLERLLVVFADTEKVRWY